MRRGAGGAGVGVMSMLFSGFGGRNIAAQEAALFFSSIKAMS